MSTDILQLQAKAERQRIAEAAPEFSIDVAQLDELSEWSRTQASDADVDRALAARHRDERDIAALLSPRALERLEQVARAAAESTLKRFGRTMHMFAPLYLSNECVSECTYCGFQVWNRDIVRRTLTPSEVGAETRYLKHRGFRHVLLVAGEHPKHVSADYIEECVSAVAAAVPDVSLEVQAWDTATYERFVAAGCDGLVIYQETYDPRVYPSHHLKGNKRFYGWRLGAPERAADAGMRRLGLGTLLGLNPDWRWEVMALAVHGRFLMRRAWGAEITLALPRIEPAAGVEAPPQAADDAELALGIAVLRLAVPDAGIVLSTREPPHLRDGLAQLGVTHMSAGSRTEPGGYVEPGSAEAQFQISDERAPEDVAAALKEMGYDPVWKDASPALRSRLDRRL